MLSHSSRLRPFLLRLLLAATCWLVAAGAPAQTPAPTATPAGPLTTAERIATLRRTIDADRAQLAASQAQLDNPDSEFQKAEAEFQRSDAEYTARQKEMLELGQSTQAEKLSEQVETLGRQRQLARERFDLAIDQRKNLRASIEALQKKIEQGTADLAKLMGDVPTPTPAPTTPQPTPAPAEAAAPGAPTATATAPPVATPAPTVASPAPVEMAMMGLAPPAATPSTAPPPPDATSAPETRLQRDVRLAQEEMAKRQADLEEVEADLGQLNDRVDALRQNMEVERRLRATALNAEDNADKTLRELETEKDQRTSEGALWSDLAPLRERTAEAKKRRDEARKESRDRGDRLDQLSSELSEAQLDLSEKMQQAEDLRAQVAKAQERLSALKQPWNPRVLLDWFLRIGLRALAILVAMALLLVLARAGSRTIAAAVAKSTETGSEEERENRAATLTSVFSATARTVIWFGGIVMVLQEVGVPIGPLLGGAAVGGLAVAFGAQNLIRDYFTGFVILLENQYAINDVIRVAGVSGLVERITLRMTVLRDTEGTVHFIPNGEIKTVSNMTSGWSRAVFDVGVAYKEDIDRVIDTVIEVGRELKADPFFKRVILEDLTMLGVDQLGESAVVIKFFIKTRPLKQWDVKRAMLRRLKRRFDELGIEIPFPQRTVYTRVEEAKSMQEMPTIRHAAVTSADLFQGQRKPQ